VRGEKMKDDRNFRKYPAEIVEKTSILGEIKPRPPKRKLYTWLFFVVVFGVIGGAYIVGYIFTHVIGGDIPQTRIEMGYYTLPTVFNGIIVRDEVVHHSNRQGELVFYVNQHTRVQNGDLVASVRDSFVGGVEEVFWSERHRQDALEALEQANFDTGDIGNLWDLGFYINYILAQDALIGRIGNIYAQDSGTVSLLTDGMESFLTLTNLSNISQDLINDTYQSGQHQFSTTAGFRIVRSNDWHIAAYLPRQYAQNFNVDSRITIFAHQNDLILPINVVVEQMTSIGDDFYVVFTTNAETLRFIDQRTIRFSLHQNPIQGYKIPQTALAVRSVFVVPREFVSNRYFGTNTVQLIDGRNVPVGGWGRGDEFLILADGGYLRTFDEIVLEVVAENAQTAHTIIHEITHIEAVTGVFQINMGFTVFRSVTLPQNFSAADEYIILDPTENPFVRLFDWIVTDARNVDNRLLLN